MSLMRLEYLRVSTLVVVCILSGALPASPVAQAAITDASGRVETLVRQTSASTGQTIDQAFEESPGTTNILPADAGAALDIATPTDVQGHLASISAVNVPGANAPQDVNDFAMEASGLSLLEGRAFTSTARATQNRQITLSASELDLDTGTRVLVRSNYVIASGVFLVTLPEGPADVTGRIRFTIQQQDAEGTREVLAGTLDVFFDSSGTLRTTAGGSLEGVLPVIVDLSGETSRVDQAQLVLLPAVTIPYEYEAVVDRPFTLIAQVDVSTDSPGGAQGGSAFVGRLPRLLADSMIRFLQVDLNEDLDILAAANRQEATGEPVAASQIIPMASGSTSTCGNFGLEGLIGGLLLTAAFVTRRVA